MPDQCEMCCNVVIYTFCRNAYVDIIKDDIVTCKMCCKDLVALSIFGSVILIA